ncbi:hypothetical protein NP493_106g07056 [Ridgeia piscesae]|uniref:Uncharacterized protein n=1 Tax=Ridgeia piscesae TaxID=27915 RepID=A0AAD9P7M8_RIDPI|nr:hypothetical protein NP493_106g07056 [Ridgeia piscesae]
MLVTVSEQSDQKVMHMRDQERREIERLQLLNEQLRHQVTEMHHVKADMQAQIERMHQEIAKEYNAHRNEWDARRLLVSDLNELRAVREESRAKVGDDDYDLAAETADPTTLRIALRKAREGEMKASQRLIVIEATYGDVIPRRDFEDLKKRFVEMEEQLELTKNDITVLKSAYNAMTEEQNKLKRETEESARECEKMRRCATPRPKWDRCADVIEGGADRWKTLSDSKTSDQLVGVLLNEIATKTVGTGHVEYFDGLGLDSSVPAYLRYEGQVRNRHLCLRDTILVITDIWKEKAIHDARRPDDPRMPLSDFLLEYFTQRFSLKQMVAEWGYNLIDACKRFHEDETENVGMFYDILRDKARFSRNADALATRQGVNGLPGAIVNPYKTPQRVAALTQAALEQLNSGSGGPSFLKSLREVTLRTEGGDPRFMDWLPILHHQPRLGVDVTRV